MKKPVIALVGRPNVGKSTLFNRLVGIKASIIEDTPGVTRDRLYGTVSHQDYSFLLIDTGGIESGNDNFQKDIQIQVSLAIDEADKVVWVLDGKEGLTTDDYIIRDMLLKTGKKVILAINKTDSKQYLIHQYDFYELGIDMMIPISSEQNRGIYDLLEAICQDFLPYHEEEEEAIKFCIIGRPNVGKSSLVNALLNENRVIVSDIAGTTRDAVDLPFTYHDQKFIAIDTAGMRKRGKIYENIEKYSLLRSLKAIDRSDISIIVLDASKGIIEHDKHIAGYAKEAGKPCILVVNKWDTVEDKEIKMKEWKELLRLEFPFLAYAPIVFLSALTKKRIHTLIPYLLTCYQNSHQMIKTSLLNDCIIEAYQFNLPPSYKGKRLRIYFSNQTKIVPPTFTISVNDTGLIHFSYKRYLENKIRESFNLEGTPIVLEFKNHHE